MASDDDAQPAASNTARTLPQPPHSALPLHQGCSLGVLTFSRNRLSGEVSCARAMPQITARLSALPATDATSLVGSLRRTLATLDHAPSCSRRFAIVGGRARCQQGHAHIAKGGVLVGRDVILSVVLRSPDGVDDRHGACFHELSTSCRRHASGTMWGEVGEARRQMACDPLLISPQGGTNARGAKRMRANGRCRSRAPLRAGAREARLAPTS